MSDTQKWGITDIPIDSKQNDKLEIHSYIDALAEVIIKTRTPMTISIQGDWGSGKTSFVKMVLEQVKNRDKDSKFEIIEFNTWEYSKFEMEDSLPVTLVCKVAEKIIEATGVKEEDLSKAMKMLKKAVFLTTKAALSYAFNGNIKDFVEESEHTPVDLVLSLKKDLENKITKSKKEFVIFIDDLDRLPPLKALEVLETLQLFLHLKNCIFILAVDYEVVSLGYKQKMGSENYPDWKSKNFFDKIIQLPFTIPNPQGTDKYLINLLKDIGFKKDILDDDFINTLIDIVNNSIQFNPRNLKRLMNSFGLLKIIISNKSEDDDKKRDIKKEQNLFECLFYLLCMQLEYPEMYNFYVQNYENPDDIEEYNSIFDDLTILNIDDSSDFDKNLEDQDDYEGIKGSNNKDDLEDNKKKIIDLAVYSYVELKKSSRKSDVQFNYLVRDFLKNYVDIFEGMEKQEHMKTLKEAINLSVTTSNTAHEAGDQGEKIGKFVQRTILNVDFTSDRGKKTLEDLKDIETSKKLFKARCVILKDVEDIKDSKEKLAKEIKEITPANKKINRYYAEPIILNDKRHYLLSSQWYENQRGRYESWLKEQDLIEE